MTEAIIVAVISLLGTIVSVFASAKVTQSKMTNELQTQNAVQNEELKNLSTDIDRVQKELMRQIENNQEIDNLKFQKIESELGTVKEDIKSHNHYAKLFSENVPVIKEKLKVSENRILDIETEIKEIRKNMK